MSFLKAEWRKLAMANYEVDESILQSYVPKGTELDIWNGTHYVSLIGFMFLNTKVLGIKIPFHVNFEEVNLRFYVRYKESGEWKRGVVFVKEIVPKAAITFVANTLYGEHYATHRMRHSWEEKTDKRIVSYEWKIQNNWQRFSVEAERQLSKIEVGSETEFITEHYWGYTKVNDRKTSEYEVTHPKWQQYLVKNYEVAVDFGLNYGEQFSFLNSAKPKSVMLAEGSEITVEGKRNLKV
ncbi:MAG: DUF2071 domain-containing protein [Bacteroidota bacterium]